MKTINHLLKRTLLLVLACSFTAFAQEEMPFVEVTTMHWNLDLEDFSMDQWRETEKMYHEKVTMKNEFVLSTTVLLHHFTSDSSEILWVRVFPSWTAIEKATQRDEELEKLAWPDAKEREAFLNKRDGFYANEHSDEIYKAFPGAKQLEVSDIPMMYYVRTSYRAYPANGTDEEFASLFSDFNTAVTYKNDHYKAYYPMTHFYGADRSEFVEVFVTENLAQLEKGLAKQGELFREHFPDEKDQEAFNEKYDKYFTGVHNDRIYSSVPELYKAPVVPEN